MHYGQAVGLSKIVDRLNELSSHGHLSVAPSQGLVRAVISNSFHARQNVFEALEMRSRHCVQGDIIYSYKMLWLAPGGG